MSKDELVAIFSVYNSGNLVFSLLSQKGGEVLWVWRRRRSLNFLRA
jgi:hypothetical protein